MEYYPATKRDEMLVYATTQLNFANSKLSEEIQMGKSYILCGIHLCGRPSIGKCER